MNKKRL